tara:strand:- start:25131 stop:26279 length:1149 start_codon:yes stop_codon:yes gene_type:complete
MFQMISQNFTIAKCMAQNNIKIQTVSVVIGVYRLIFLQHNLKRKIQFGVETMSALNILKELTAKSVSKLALAFVMTFFLSACGAGGEATPIDDAVDSQASTETEEQAPVQIDPVQISSQPQNLTVDSGSAAVFSVTAAGGGELGFQWRKNQQNIQGAVARTLTLSNVSVAEAGLYDVVVSNSEGDTVSLSALLTVNAPVVIVEPIIDPVVITSQPQAVSVYENTAASFSVQVTGDGDISYQWLKGGEVINGATSSSLTIASVMQADVDNYSVIVTNAGGPVFSEPANLSMTPVQVVSSIELTWDIPQQREDGSDLALYEINGYVIAYGTDESSLTSQLTIESGQATSTILEDLSSGTYYFSIATVDSDGVQGAYSSVIQQSI